MYKEEMLCSKGIHVGRSTLDLLKLLKDHISNSNISSNEKLSQRRALCVEEEAEYQTSKAFVCTVMFSYKVETGWSEGLDDEIADGDGFDL